MIQRIAMIGDGAMATVSSNLLVSKGCRVTLWGFFPEHIQEMVQDQENRRFLPGVRLSSQLKLTTNAASAFDGADLIVSAVPCQFMRGVWRQLAEHVPPGVPVVSVAKGIENDTLLRPTQILTDVLGDRPVAALSGPSIATELAKCLPATVVASSADSEFARTVQQVFTTQWFRVYTNTDLVGVELAGATKNVIALAAGMVDGLGAGDNAKSALLARGLVEITRLGVALGAERETFFGLAGLGDLVTTCISPHGRNRTAGERIGKGMKVKDVLDSIESVVEGVPTTKSVIQLADRHDVEMPITRGIYQILFEDKDVIEAVTQLMSRSLKPEAI
ncbi:MAG: Glycerol-3-phosphate dehydrogenase [NAD(P)+] [Phycisphaerae bacterium]|nr:Glycerol-3-phosphate dehydrogenase [NAD(P)+] [Phycisphaerae bacterium]